jgi:succinate dehydrogenase / fumarate reductase membrane anchor subunit
MSLRSPLGKVLGSGSAKDGTGHWWAQRVSAAALVVLGIWFLYAMQQLADFGIASVTAWIARPFNSIMLLLLLLTLAYHSFLGLQVIVEDYVHGPFVKVISLILNKFFHFFLSVAALLLVLKIALGDAA